MAHRFGVPKRTARAFALALGVGLALSATARAEDAYRNPALAPEARAADLVAHMTLEEKAPQLLNDAPAITRLGVREYNWWSEGLHGVAAHGVATVFPQAIGLAASFDAPLLHDVADTIGVEFRAKYLESRHRMGGSDWFAGLTVWSPNINIFRDPRWGRGQETYGEDPFLTARMGVAFVSGLQGNDPTYLRAVSTPKHFAVHSGPEPNRHREDVHPSAHDLEDTYLPAFRATVTEANAGSVMCAYNSINGAPACASDLLLKTHLRDAWGFKGYVVSDCDAVGNIYRANEHAFTATPEQGVAAAFNAGMDVICGDAFEIPHILNAVRTGVLKEATIDRALTRLFTARMRLGEFDPPGSAFPTISAKDYDTPAHRAQSLKMAQASMVLLKNDGLLPLKSDPRSIAVIGPNADSVDALVGNYNGDPSHPVTVVSGLKARYPNAKIVYAQGTGLIEPALAPTPNDVLCADARCRQSGLLAEYFASREFAGAPKLSRVEANAQMRWDGEMRTGAVRWSGYLKAPESGEYRFRYDGFGGYRVFIDDKPIVDAWNVDWRASIATGKATLEAGRVYKIRIETFQRDNHGDEKLLWSLPSDQGAKAAFDAANGADLVVFVGGLSHRIEGEEMRIDAPGFEGGDRTSLDLPAPQERLLEKLATLGKPVVLVLMNGSAMSVNWADAHVPAIVEAWYPGGEGGAAVAGLIAGDFSPSGRLPLTFYKSVDQLPAFEDYAMSKCTYRYFDGAPLYPFGYGLSYTHFAYKDARVSAGRLRAGRAQTLSVAVTNDGARDGDEVVQLYLARPGVAGAPRRALAGFQRVHLARGETKRVTFTLTPRDMSTVDPQGVRRVAPGAVEAWLGGGQPNARGSSGVAARFTIAGEETLPR